MKKIGELMQDMGFNENASMDAKKAFLKHLMRDAQLHDRITSIDKYQGPTAEDTSVPPQTLGEQLSLFAGWDSKEEFRKKKTS